MRIKNHNLIGLDVEYHSTIKKSGKIKPKFVVIHYTATDNFNSDVITLSTSNAKVSCHLVISPDGKIAQIGKLNDKLWHAGESHWKGYNGLNSYSIGIEVTCPGPLDEKNGELYTWYNKKYNDNVVLATHKNGGKQRYWAKFTKKQIEVLQRIVPLIQDYYDIIDVVGHDDISPNRKQDPGPSMPDNLWSFFKGRKYDNYESTPANEKYGIVSVTKNLNFRDSPQINSNIIGSLPDQTLLKIINVGESWIHVETPNGHRGYVFKKYIDLL